MDWKEKLRKAFVSGLCFSMMYNLIFIYQGVSIAKFVGFVVVFTILYFLWLLLVPDKKDKF